MGLFTSYLVITGTLTATLQFGRGLVRAGERLIQGDPKGALVEVGGGILAPTISLANQGFRLAGDIFQVASTLNGNEGQESDALPWSRKEEIPQAAGF